MLFFLPGKSLDVLKYSAIFQIIPFYIQDIPLVCVCGNHDVGNRPNAVRKALQSTQGHKICGFQWLKSDCDIYHLTAHSAGYRLHSFLPKSI